VLQGGSFRFSKSRNKFEAPRDGDKASPACTPAESEPCCDGGELAWVHDATSWATDVADSVERDYVLEAKGYVERYIIGAPVAATASRAPFAA
jgi:hypothetical protein